MSYSPENSFVSFESWRGYNNWSVSPQGLHGSWPYFFGANIDINTPSIFSKLFKVVHIDSYDKAIALVEECGSDLTVVGLKPAQIVNFDQTIQHDSDCGGCMKICIPIRFVWIKVAGEEFDKGYGICVVADDIKQLFKVHRDIPIFPLKHVWTYPVFCKFIQSLKLHYDPEIVNKAEKLETIFNNVIRTKYDLFE